jgi:TPR repeat protein
MQHSKTLLRRAAIARKQPLFSHKRRAKVGPSQGQSKTRRHLPATRSVREDGRFLLDDALARRSVFGVRDERAGMKVEPSMLGYRTLGLSAAIVSGRTARVALFCLGGLLLSPLLSAPAPALDAQDARATAAASTPLPIFKDPRAALRAGLESYHGGDTRASVEALRYAADGGEAIAAWKLARMYADGDGVPRDDRKAFDYFAKIVEHFSNDDPSPSERSLAANAFNALGAYLRGGVANAQIAADPERAFDLFRYAAVFLRNGDAQYNVARMYLEGVGVKKDPRQAMNWLDLAARKGHAQAQALLGQLMLEGSAAERPRGLMFLTLAKASASDRPSEQWIADAHAKALASASDADRRAAEGMAASYLKRRD